MRIIKPIELLVKSIESSVKNFLTSEDVKVALLLLILSCIFFWKVILNPEKIIFAEYFSDVIELFYPYKALVHDVWQSNGRLPLWNPYTFMGNPIVGNVLYAMFHPYNLFYFFFSPEPLFGLLFLVDTFLIGLFTYFFMKLIGVRRFGSLVSAVAFMFSGVVVARIYAGHPINLDIIAMVPLSFFVLEVAIQKRSLFYGCLAGIPIALQLLGGNIQVALYGITTLGIYFILRLFFIFRKTPKGVIKPLIIAVLAIMVGISLSAVQLLPSLELLGLSERFEPNYEEATAYSFSPEQSLTLLMPEFFGTYLDYTYWGERNFWELCVYTGVFSIVFTIIAIIGVKNEYKIIFLILLALSFLFALGRYFPIYMIFYRFVPFFDMFRKPATMLFMTAFSLSVLSGFGADSLFEIPSSGTKFRDTKFRKRLSILIKLLMVASALTLIATLCVHILKDEIISFGGEVLKERYKTFTSQIHSLPYELEFYINKIPEVYVRIRLSLIIFLITLSSITALLYVRISKNVSIKYLQLAILIIILSDLWYFGMKYIDVIDTEIIFSKRPIIGYLEGMGRPESETKFRILNMGVIPQYITIKYKIETIGGYEAVQLKNYLNFINYYFGGEKDKEIGYAFLNVEEDKILNNSKILGLLNVKYILTQTQFNDSYDSEFIFRHNITTNVYVKSLSNYQYKSNRGGYIPSNLTTQVYVYENKNFLPRAFVVRNARILGDGETILRELGKSDFDSKETIILEEDVGVPLKNSGTYKQLGIEYYSPNEIIVNVYMDSPGFLVLSENYYPGWKAVDNGKETEIYKTDYILRSVYLTTGQHTVKFEYEPLSYVFGFWVSFITTVALCVFVLYKIKSCICPRCKERYKEG